MYSVKDNVKDSFKLAWKYKILWVFALLISMGGGGGGGSGGSESNKQEFPVPFENSPDSKMELNVSKPQEAPPESISAENTDTTSPFGSMVKGASDKAKDIVGSEVPAGDLSNLVNIPMALVIFISMFAFIIYVIILVIMLRYWARGSLIAGTKAAQDNPEKLDLFSISTEGLKSMGRLFKLDVLIGLNAIGALLLLIIPVMVYFAFNKAMPAIIIGGILLLLVIYILIKLILASYYADRHIVLNDAQSRESFKKGMGYYKKNKKYTFALASINTLILLFFGAVFLGIMGSVVLFMINNMGSSDTTIGLLIILAVPLFIVAFMVIQIINGFLGTYRQFTWTRLFRHLDGQGNEMNKVAGEQA